MLLFVSSVVCCQVQVSATS